MEPSSFQPTTPLVRFEQLTDDIRVSQRAALKVYELLFEEEEQEHFSYVLRVSITGGGCAGFKYDFKFDQSISDKDFVVETPVVSKNKSIIRVVISSLCFDYLRGSQIDYESGLSGEYFIIRDLKTSGRCSCGSSFDV